MISDYILKDNLRKNSDLVKSRFDLKDIIKNISNSVISDPPANVQKGSFIKDGVDIKLDEYRKLSKNAKDWLVTYQQKIKDETGINKLKVGYNRVFGYYIEVTNTHLDKIPDYFIRKQTLTSAERFFTEELKEYEDKILSAEENIVKIEMDIFNSLRDSILLNIENILANSKILAKLDISTSFSKLSEDKKYIRPILLNDKKIEIIGARHPVIEDLLDFNDEFIPNDIKINIKKNQVSLITGPNMSGKSTYLRQIGIIVILAQSGCYVPCESAKISIIDRLFTRVGASDNLAGGESTFLVEMNETANILNNLTNNSLILLDEIGRGTSTYDGLSIAWAITEYLHNSKKSPITLFATHYHELINLVENLNNAENYSVMVKEDDDNVVFLRKIIKGGTDKSYGIHVAKMSGIPKRVINRANHILSSLSSEEKSIDFDNKEYDEVDKNEDQIKDFLESMKSIDVNNISPIESLILLKQLKDDACEIN